MITVKLESNDFKKVFKNTVQYTEGFIQGINLNRLEFNRVLGGYTAEALGMYIDSKARSNPEMLHHVYEWKKTGDRSSRLFKINVNATNTSILLNGKFVLSNQPASESGQVFSNKAEIMENAISVTISPKNSPVLVFQDGDETVFTTKSIYVAHPGGDQVAGSFGGAIEEFFNSYFVFSILEPLMKKLRNPKEFSAMFSQGAKSGKSVGVIAGRKYFSYNREAIV
jgi:hypothetical protein